jgi:hypothetical protein
MIKRALLTLIIATAFGLGLTSSAKADVIATIGPFDEAPDFSGVYPLAEVNLGTFSFSIPLGFVISSATISGTFGDEDVPGTTEITADSDYYVDGTAVHVASCDSPNVVTLGLSLACDGGNNPADTPTPWSYTFTAANLSAISGNLASGSLDFNEIQNYYGAVNAGTVTLDIAGAVATATTPEPGTICIVSLGLAGIALLRRRKV